MFDGCRWLNEPTQWGLAPAALTVRTGHGTDFWRETHYGFTRHSGHFFGQTAPPSFTATLRVRAKFEALYDQAGIMVLVDEAHWVKAGVEMYDNEAAAGSVVTIGRSDWATGPFGGDPADFWIRAIVDASVLCIQSSADGQRWRLLRLCPFPVAEHYMVGPMCCTPERAGLEVLFSDFSVAASAGAMLHQPS
jgi:regulation of enolase protein 1 (concanavalin A-like superfamily)